jgi:hypothetical protein
MDLHDLSPPEYTHIHKEGLNSWMDFIEVWYLIVYIVGQCPVEINIIASKI